MNEKVVKNIYFICMKCVENKRHILSVLKSLFTQDTILLVLLLFIMINTRYVYVYKNRFAEEI